MSYTGNTRSMLVLLLATLALAACSGGGEPAPKTYSYFSVGNPEASVQLPPPAEPSWVAMGGGPDVDAAFRWMIERSGVRPGTGGRFVIIRASGGDAYNPYIYYSDENSGSSRNIAPDWVGGASLGLSSVETLVIPDRESANDAFVNAVVGRANAVFIAGGDQSDYIRYWKNTALHRTLDRLMQYNIPVGGTSAGLAVLGQFDFAALNDTVTSEEALADPFNFYMTLDPDPLSLSGGFLVPAAFRNTILDSHLDTRDRMGRLLTFVSRLVTPVGSAGCAGGILAAGTSPLNGARGIGVGVETALLVQGNGVTTPFTGRRVTNPSTSSESAVYFVRPMQLPSVCVRNTTLAVNTMELRKLNDDAVFNLSDWSGKPAYFIDVNKGVLSASPY